MSTKECSKGTMEEEIKSLLSNNLMSVTQISKELGVRKDVGSATLESMRKQGKLELHEVGRSKVYTLPGTLKNNEVKEEKSPEKNLRTIGIVSGKGGTGKTTTTLNLTGALMDFKNDVMAVDADVKMGGLGLHLGIYNPASTLNNVIKNDTSLLEALHIHSTGLRLIPVSLSTENLDLSDLYQNLTESLKEETIILIDSPSGLEENSIKVLKACKEVIIVTTPNFQSLTNSIKIKDKAKDLGVKLLGIIVNRYTGSRAQKKLLKEIESICELPVLGIVPEDKSIREGIFKKTPNIFLNPYSRSSLVYKQIAAKISGKDYRSPKFAFFKNLWRKLS